MAIKMEDFNQMYKDTVKFSKRSQKTIAAIKEKTEKLSKYGQFVKTSVGLGKLQIENEQRLSSIIKIKNKATAAETAEILKLTSVQEASGVVSDDVQMAGAEQLSGFVGSAKSIKTLIPAMNNLLASQKGISATGEDAANIATLIGKGFEGQVDGLKAVGIGFSQAEENILTYGKEEEKVAVLAQAIEKSVGNVNAEMAKTDVGAIAQVQSGFTRLQEEIGKMLLPYLGQFATWFSENLPVIQEKILTVVGAVIEGGKKVFEVIKKVLDFFAKYQWLATFLMTFIGVLTALTMGIMGLSTVISALSIVQGFFNLTLGSCPLIWIVAAIAAVIAIIVALIVHWDEVKAAAEVLWGKITGIFQNIKDSIMEAVGAIIDTVGGIIDKVKEVWGALKGFFDDPLGSTIEVIGKVGGKSAEKRDNKKDNPPKVGVNALGTSYWKGGLTHINERGGEIVDLPNGSRVIPADKSKGILGRASVTFGNIYVTAKGVTAEEVVNELVPKLKIKMANI